MNNIKPISEIDETKEDQPVKVRGKYTHEEIMSQPEAWADAIQILRQESDAIRYFKQSQPCGEVIFTGCGSTYYLSLAAAGSFQGMTGVPTRGLPASEMWLSPTGIFLPKRQILLVAVSRSGETTETIQACKAFRDVRRGKIITLVCQPGSTLSEMGDINLVFPSAMEKSVAQTRAFSTLYLVAIGLSAIWMDNADPFDQLCLLPEIGKKVISSHLPLSLEYGKNLGFDRIYILGSGVRLGLAAEISLKMKEMSLTHSEAFHFMEFRHGPKSMVNRQTLVVGFVSEANITHELAVLSDIEQLGGSVMSLGEDNTELIFGSGLKEVYRNILYLPFGQMLAYERSLAKGLDPDRPTNLDAVVKLTN